MNKMILRIGYKDFFVRYVNKFKDKKQVGECELPIDRIKGIIRIKRGMDSVERANTIIHEILHAIWYTQGIGLESKTEERVVCAITNGLIGFMRDNPEYTQEIIDMLEG